jgi:hypothetical protein
VTVYERRITFRPGAVDGRPAIDAQMQDFCHHIRVTLSHDGGRVITARAEGIRLPWNTCPIGIAGVRGMEGLDLAAARDIRRWDTGPTDNCTHAGDLALLAAAHALDTEPLTYEITVDPAGGPQRVARLAAGGRVLLEWTVAGFAVTGPGEWAGRSLARRDFAEWSATLDPTTAEYATVLRRACHIAPSRDVDLDRLRVAADSIPPSSSCYTLQPGVIERAGRRRGSSLPLLTPESAH